MPWIVNAPKEPAGTEFCSSGVFVPATCRLSHRGCPSAVAQARVAAPSAVGTLMVRMMAEAESRKSVPPCLISNSYSNYKALPEWSCTDNRHISSVEMAWSGKFPGGNPLGSTSWAARSSRTSKVFAKGALGHQDGPRGWLPGADHKPASGPTETICRPHENRFQRVRLARRRNVLATFRLYCSATLM